MTTSSFTKGISPIFSRLARTLFVTFRLAGSIPKHVLRLWKAEKDWLDKEADRIVEGEAHDQRLLQFRRRWFQKFEDLMHKQNHGPMWLAENFVAEIVSESLRHRDGKVYRLDAYCIMSNHVHAVFAPLLTDAQARALAEKQEGSEELCDRVLSVIMHSLKGFTARKANLALGRLGQFWEHESYDHVIRVGKYDRVVNYVLNNPVKAGLVSNWRDWKWSWMRGAVT